MRIDALAGISRPMAIAMEGMMARKQMSTRRKTAYRTHYINFSSHKQRSRRMEARQFKNHSETAWPATLSMSELFEGHTSQTRRILIKKTKNKTYPEASNAIANKMLQQLASEKRCQLITSFQGGVGPTNPLDLYVYIYYFVQTAIFWISWMTRFIQVAPTANHRIYICLEGIN
jgi:hypothetical protein